MASAVFSDSALKAKFRGCLIGALVGDCLGNPFDEIVFWRFKRPPKQKLFDFMNELMNGESTEILVHSDDTRMTICIASSLTEKGELNAKDVAEKITKDYYNQKINRYYGGHVRHIFRKLKESNYEDVFIHAREQFGGMGSYGNGAAMRTAPIALFGNNKGEDYVMNASKECALITHYHKDGYRGAILQCLAVKAALELDSSQELNPVKFIDHLLKKMENIEKEVTPDQKVPASKSTSFLKNMWPLEYFFGDVKPYCDSLKTMKEIFLQNKEDISADEIAECLGCGLDISALKSVPTAIYSFLRGMKPLTDYESSNPFLRTIFFAISCGGDTDTITTMAGAIAGAYYGEEMIPDVVQKRCEAIDEVISLADKLFDTTYKKE